MTTTKSLETMRKAGSLGPRALALLFCAASMLGSACSATSAIAPSIQASHRTNARSASCPLHVDLTTVHAEDVDGGSSLVFATRTNVGELQRRVAHLADRYAGRNLVGERGPRDESIRADPDRQAPTVPSAARAENLGRGARIVFTPRDPARLDDLRREVHAKAAHMTSPRCRPQTPVGD